MTVTKLPDHAAFCQGDLRVMSNLITKLSKPLTNANWENECKLLDRQAERTIKSLQALRKALVSPKPA